MERDTPDRRAAMACTRIRVWIPRHDAHGRRFDPFASLPCTSSRPTWRNLPRITIFAVTPLMGWTGSSVLAKASIRRGRHLARLRKMAEIEKDKAAFVAADVTVLPIVMSTREQITTDMATYGVTTPFLLNDGKVPTAYKTIGPGMHAGLPGHSFVLIDSTGVQRLYGKYPSMWLAPKDLLAEV